MVLDWGACRRCPENCGSCSSIDKCDTCLSGFYLSPQTSQCLDCDSNQDEIVCNKCSPPATSSGANQTPQCLSCASGYNLDPSTSTCRTCEQITGVSHCTECDPQSKNCDKCGTGYYLPEDGNGVKTQECKLCHDQFEFCGQCI